MATYGSIWVKITHPVTDLPLLQTHYNPDAALPDGTNFACARAQAADAETPTGQMQELSQRFQEAIFMSVQTVVDFFLYSHWKNGELVRQIQYCADEGWYELLGEKEDWERALFSEEEKLRQLGYLDLDRLSQKPDAAEYADAQRLAAQIETVWEAKTLVPDSFYPMATASDLYGWVMQAFGLANPYT